MEESEEKLITRIEEAISIYPRFLQRRAIRMYLKHLENS
jgi:hypothetical protein